MIEPTCTVTFLACCDRCGAKMAQNCAATSSHDAIVRAKQAGWKVEEWFYENSYRQTVICPNCDRHLQAVCKEQARVT